MKHKSFILLFFLLVTWTGLFSANYLVVLGDPAYSDEIQNFVQFKQNQGRSVRVEVLSGYPYLEGTDLDTIVGDITVDGEVFTSVKKGNQNYVVLKHYIKKWWQEEGQPSPFYVLLVGAAEKLSPYFNGYREDLLYQVTWRIWRDHEYWNLDTDADFEAMVGRWPVYTEQDVTTIADKTMHYANVYGTWTEDIRVWGSFDEDAQPLAEYFRTHTPYTVTELYGTSDIYNNVTQQFFQEGHSLYLYRGHGGPYVWNGGDYATKDFYENGLPYPGFDRGGVMLSIACDTGFLYDITQHPFAGSPDVWGMVQGEYRNIGEQWMLQANGGVAFFGASVYMSSGTDQDLAWELTQDISDNGVRDIGALALHSKTVTPQYNLLGDPDLDIVFRATPATAITVDVTDASANPVCGQVTVYEDGTTNVAGSGSGNHVVIPLTAGTYDLKVTASGYQDEWVYDIQLANGENETIPVTMELTPLLVDLAPVGITLNPGSLQVQVQNNGSQGTSATLSATVLKKTTGGGTNVLLNADFETANPFTFGGTQTCWAWGVPSYQVTSAHGGTKVIATNPSGKYNRNENSWASASVNLSGTAPAYLEFWHAYDFHGGYSSDYGDDIGVIEISTNGSTWTRVNPQGGYPDTAVANPVYAAGTPCYAGKVLQWNKVTVDLSSYSGTVYFRFRLITDSSWIYAGWYIDDVKVYEEVVEQWVPYYQSSQSFTIGGQATTNVNFTQSFTDGSYRVTAETICGQDTVPGNNALTQEIKLGNVLPTANFTYQTSNLDVNFTDTSTDSDGTIVSRSWNFGDSQTSTQQNPSHHYQSSGSYTVTLTVTDNQGGVGSTSKVVQVTEDPNLLQNNVPVTGLNGATGSSLNYRISVPAGAFNLKITTTGSTGDAELYVKFGSAPTTSVYDFRSIASGSNETITIASPGTGTYHILVYGDAAYTNVTLLAKYDGPFNGPVYTNDTDYNIPDNNTTGVQSPVTVTRTGDSIKVKVTVDIIHTYSGDLTLTLIAPNNTEWVLRARQGGSVDNIKESYSVDTPGIESSGVWKLKVQDLASISTGYINSWLLQFLN